MVTQTIKIDLTKDIITDHIIFKQGEIGREIEFEVYNNGVAVDLDGYDVTFSVYKPDGNFVIVSGTIDNDTVTIEETEQMTAVCGSGCFDLALTKTNEVIYTFKGFVDIATPILTRETVNSVSMVFGLVFPDDFQEKLTAGENITIVDNVISASGGGGGSYTAGEYITILNDVIDVKSSLISTINGKADASALNGKQDTLTAGTYIDIDASNNIDVKSSLISTINGKADASALNGKQDTLTAGTYIDIDASNNIDVKSSLISTINGKADASALNGKQDTLTAGTGITIDSDNVISASGGGGGDNVHFNVDTYIQSDLYISKNQNNLCTFHLETTFTNSTASTGYVFPTPTSEQRPYLPQSNKHNLYTGVLISSGQLVPVIVDLNTYNDGGMTVSLYSLGGGVRGRYSGEQLTVDGIYMGNGV